MGGSAYRKHAAGNSMEGKSLYGGHQSGVVKCLCWKAALHLYPASLLLSIFFVFWLLSVCQSRLRRSVSSLLLGDSPDMPQAKGNLFCTSSMHHVAVCVDSTCRKCETDRGAYIDLLQCAHSPCYSCFSQEAPPGSSLVTGAFHISGYWIEQDE